MEKLREITEAEGIEAIIRAASDASLVLGLVEALEAVKGDMSSGGLQDSVLQKIDAALSSLPQEYRNATQEQDDDIRAN